MMSDDKWVALLDYGAGNIKSVGKALAFLKARVRWVSSADEMEGASAVVLPGVGAFDDCLQALGNRELLEGCRRFIDSGRPFLGICVGYQALFEGSDEFQSCSAGMGVFKGRVRRFSTQPGLKIPQIGWNQVRLTRSDCPIFKGIPDGSHFYFVHGYYPVPEDPSIVVGETTYGDTFASAVWRDRVFATQFHPEKSQKVGLRLLSNFLALLD